MEDCDGIEPPPGRVRVERGIYRQPNGKYAVCWRHAGRLRFKTFGTGTGDVARGGTPPWAGPGTAELVASFHEDECE